MYLLILRLLTKSGYTREDEKHFKNIVSIILDKCSQCDNQVFYNNEMKELSLKAYREAILKEVSPDYAAKQGLKILVRMMSGANNDLEFYNTGIVRILLEDVMLHWPSDSPRKNYLYFCYGLANLLLAIKPGDNTSTPLETLQFAVSLSMKKMAETLEYNNYERIIESFMLAIGAIRSSNVSTCHFAPITMSSRDMYIFCESIQIAMSGKHFEKGT